MTFRGIFQPKLFYDAIISQSSLRTHSSQSENKKFSFQSTIQNSIKIRKTSPNFSITCLNRSETKPWKTLVSVFFDVAPISHFLVILQIWYFNIYLVFFLLLSLKVLQLILKWILHGLPPRLLSGYCFTLPSSS